jgi:hypothetical protein
MRPVVLVCAFSALLSGGCAVLVARSGKDPSEATTRDDVHQAFGTPVAVGGADGEKYEDFCYHGKVAENMRASLMMLAWYGSLGWYDLYAFPCETCRACWMPLVGYDLRFYYDANGNVTRHSIDGVPGMPWPLRDLHKTPPSSDPLLAEQAK